MKAAAAPARCPLGAWFLQRFMCALALALALAALLPVAAFAEALPDVSSGIVIDEASFPDPTFREYVRDRAEGDWLTQDAIDGITDIDVADRGIESLQGIEYFTALQWLNCENNRLTALDLSKNTALKHLQCNYNYLTGLDLEHNTNLVWSGIIAQLIPVDVSTSSSLDLNSLNPAIDPDKIKELEGAKLEGTMLSGMTAGTVATYAYGLNYYLPDGTGQAELHMEVVLELTNSASDLYLTDESLFPVSSDAFSLADDGTLIIKGSDTYTVRMVHNGQQPVRHAVEIAAGASPTVQLYNLNIQMQQGSCLVVEPGAGDVTLQLLGENRLESLAGGAGILKNNGNASLTIIGSS